MVLDNKTEWINGCLMIGTYVAECLVLNLHVCLSGVDGVGVHLHRHAHLEGVPRHRLRSLQHSGSHLHHQLVLRFGRVARTEHWGRRGLWRLWGLGAGSNEGGGWG
jgi:hypothetical protein